MSARQPRFRKLTPEQVRAIRGAASKLTNAELAKMYDVSENVVQKIQTFSTYKDIK